MSERSGAPRSGGRPALPRTTAGKRGSEVSRDAVDRGTGARGVRQVADRDENGRSDVGRSDAGRSDAGRSDAGRSGKARGENVRGRNERADVRRGTGRDQAGRDQAGRDKVGYDRVGRDSAVRGAGRDSAVRGEGRRPDARRDAVRADDTRRSGMRRGEATRRGEGTPRGGDLGRGEGTRRGGDNPVAGTAALALEVTSLEVTAAAPVTAGRPRLWVAPPLPIRAPRATFAASVIVLVLAGVLGILLINTKTMEQSFRLDALRKEQTALAKQQQGLEQQLIQASNPGNLHAAARRLGLVMAPEPAMIRMPDGKMSKIPTPGRGRPGPMAQDGLGKPTSDGRAAGDKAAGAQQDVPAQGGAQQGAPAQGAAQQGQTPVAGAGQ